MPLEAYQLPNFLALLPEKPSGKINPHHKEVETIFNAWVEKKLDGPCAIDVYHCDNPLFIAAMFPLASYEQLKGIVDYTAAGYMLDDLLECSTGESVQSLALLWMNALRDANGGQTVPYPLIELMRSDLFHGIRAVISPAHWTRFIAGHENFLGYMAQAVHDREMNVTLDIQTYMASSRFSSGAYINLVLVQVSRCLFIPDDVLTNPTVREMEDAMVDVACICNDVHSFKKEYAFDGASHNLLTAIQKDPETAHLDFQGRLDYAKKLFKIALDRFYASRRALPSFNPEIDQCLDLYADGLIDMVIGNLEWSSVNQRHNTFANDEDRMTNIMRLDLG